MKRLCDNYNIEKSKNRESVSRWKKQKESSMVLADAYRRAGLTDRADHVRDCARYLHFDECSLNSNHKKSLKSAVFCRDRLCTICAARRSNVVFAQTMKMVNHISGSDPNIRYINLTLTSRNVPAEELSDLITLQLKSFRRMTQHKRFIASIEGFVRSMEITYNATEQTYHPHIHVILAVQKLYFHSDLYLSQDDFTLMWRKALGADYTPIVHVQATKQKNETSGEIQSAVAELAKYAVKPDFYDVNDPDLPQVVSTLHHALKYRRLLAFGGIFKWAAKALKLQDVDSSDLIHLDDDPSATVCQDCGAPLLRVVYRWITDDYYSVDRSQLPNEHNHPTSTRGDPDDVP